MRRKRLRALFSSPFCAVAPRHCSPLVSTPSRLCLVGAIGAEGEGEDEVCDLRGVTADGWTRGPQRVKGQGHQ